MEKQKNIACSRCLSVVFVTQHAKRMRRITLSSVASMALSHISWLSRKSQDFLGKGGGVIQQLCFNFLYSFLAEIFLILGRIQ